MQYNMSIRKIISIHAPPRGATPQVLGGSYGSFVFQFTPLREGRRHRVNVGNQVLDFNSRPSARGDADYRRIPGDTVFQFTPLREGRLGAMMKSMGIADISIHAPPRGAT